LGFVLASRLRATVGFSVTPRDSLGEKPTVTQNLGLKRSNAAWDKNIHTEAPDGEVFLTKRITWSD
jgi:hypothetical protein